MSAGSVSGKQTDQQLLVSAGSVSGKQTDQLPPAVGFVSGTQSADLQLLVSAGSVSGTQAAQLLPTAVFDKEAAVLQLQSAGFVADTQLDQQLGSA